MSLLIRRPSSSYGVRSIRSSRRQYDAIRHSDIPPRLSCPKISNDISTEERLAPTVPSETLLGTVGRSRLSGWAQSCWQRLCYFHYETSLNGRSRLKQARPRRQSRTRSRCCRSTISAKKKKTPILPMAFKGTSSQIYQRLVI